jgi:hypothetical protein
MSIVAVVPVANLIAANAALAAWGPGPHFSVSGLSATGLTHGALHDWGGNPAYVAAIKALPGVLVDETPGEPGTRLRALFAGVNAQWPVVAPPFPNSGLTVAGRIYSFGSELWLSIVAFNRTTFPGPPSSLAPSIIRRRRWPGEVLPWVQPLDQFDAYFTVDPITGQPDRVTFNGRRYRSTIPGVPNVWQPGGAEWIDEGVA